MSGIVGALNIAKKSLLTSQKALEVTGNNIANVNTPGYSRETPIYTESPSLMMNGLVVGSGANISQVIRQYDAFVTRQLREKNSTLGEETGRSEPLTQLESIMSISETSLAGDIDEFFGAWQDLSTDPGDKLARNTVIDTGVQLTDTFSGMLGDLESLKQAINTTLPGKVSALNANLEELADLNQRIVNIETAGPQAMAARDRRDVLLEEISFAIGGKYIEESDGMVSYYLDNGMPVVQEQTPFLLSTTRNGSSVDLELKVNSQSFSLGLDNVGGELRGLLSVRDETIPGVIDDLDKLAYSLGSEVNRIHQLGTGMDGIGGRDFFAPLTQQSGAANALTVAISDFQQVAAGLSGATGDNNNALALGSLGSALVVDGSQTFTGFYGQITSQVGIEVGNNDLAVSGNQDALVQLQNLRDATAGVSVEEEMINLISYQKSFEASAKLLTTVNEMLDILMSAKR